MSALLCWEGSRNHTYWTDNRNVVNWKATGFAFFIIVQAFAASHKLYLLFVTTRISDLTLERYDHWLTGILLATSNDKHDPFLTFACVNKVGVVLKPFFVRIGRRTSGPVICDRSPITRMSLSSTRCYRSLNILTPLELKVAMLSGGLPLGSTCWRIGPDMGAYAM